MEAYSAFAEIYDILMDDNDYGAWASYYIEAASKHGLDTGKRLKVIDTACGTGGLSIPLAMLGHDVTGVDISAEMLGIAAAKARAKGLRIPFIQQDISKLETQGKADLIVCACDGVNYLSSADAATAFFARARASLNDGGLLIFDISSRYKIENVLAKGFFAEEREDAAYIWQNRYDEANRLLEMDISFFIRQNGDTYRRYCETHYQKAYDANELSAMLKSSGFAFSKAYGWQTFEPPEPACERVLLVNN